MTRVVLYILAVVVTVFGFWALVILSRYTRLPAWIVVLILGLSVGVTFFTKWLMDRPPPPDPPYRG